MQDLTASRSGTPFDIAIIGAGIVGCAMARRFTLEGAKVVVIEKASDILDGASKANSAILHTGFDAPTGSLELSCIQGGYREYIDIHEQFGLPLEKSGAHVVAWSAEDEAALDGIVAQAHANNVQDVSLISAQQLRRCEPGLAESARAAITVPGEAIIDPWSAPYAYLRQSLLNGGDVFLDCEVTGGSFSAGMWELATSRGTVHCAQVINCAGLYGDLIDKTVLGAASFDIKPRKGQFVVFDKAAASLINSVILPVPTRRTKGVVVFRTVFGNLAVGPTAEDQEARADTATDQAALRTLIAAGIAKVPALETIPITAVYAGLRPATQYKDYQIAAQQQRNWITVGGIRSTGLSSALGIARHVFELYCDQAEVAGGGQKDGAAPTQPQPQINTRTNPQDQKCKHIALRDPQVPPVARLAESTTRDWRCAGHGSIVCHCELVSEREIKAALKGPLAARSLAGLKRQTRATMGRCQGFYCSARLAELTDGHFDVPLAPGAEKNTKDVRP